MGKLKRITWHWDAGSGSVSDDVLACYHFIILPDGSVRHGKHAPEANCVRPLMIGRYAAHALNANFENIGGVMLGLRGAKERPFDHCPNPINETQVTAMADLSAALCQIHDIPVSRVTTLSHGEIQPTLGIAQNGKWDVAWLPGMSGPGDPVEVGDRIRLRVAQAMGVTQIKAPARASDPSPWRPRRDGQAFAAWADGSRGRRLWAPDGASAA